MPYYEEDYYEPYVAAWEDQYRYEQDNDYRDLYVGPPDPVEQEIDVMFSIINRIKTIGTFYVPFHPNQLREFEDIPF